MDPRASVPARAALGRRSRAMWCEGAAAAPAAWVHVVAPPSRAATTSEWWRRWRAGQWHAIELEPLKERAGVAGADEGYREGSGPERLRRCQRRRGCGATNPRRRCL